MKGGPIPRTIRELRAEVRTLRAEAEQLHAENSALAERDRLRDRLQQIEKGADDLLPIMCNFPLTRVKRRLLGVLYRTPDIVGRERLRVLMWGVDSDQDPKGLDVHICQLRRMAKPHNITIETIHDTGYRLPPESRLRVAALIEKQRRAAAAAINPSNGSHKGEQHAVESRA